MLSLSSGAGQSYPNSAEPAEDNNGAAPQAERRQVNGTARQQPAAKLQPEMVRLERQQLMVSSSAEVELLAQQSQQLRLADTCNPLPPLAKRPVAATLSNEPPATGQQLELELLPPQAPQSSRNLVKQLSIKRTNFFQGFRHTFRGRRGSKSAHLGNKQPAELVESSSEAATSHLAQSHSLSSISEPTVGATKKVRHKLLTLNSSTVTCDSSSPPIVADQRQLLSAISAISGGSSSSYVTTTTTSSSRQVNSASSSRTSFKASSSLVSYSGGNVSSTTQMAAAVAAKK